MSLSKNNNSSKHQFILVVTNSVLTIILHDFKIVHHMSTILFQNRLPRLQLVSLTNHVNLITLVMGKVWNKLLEW